MAKREVGIVEDEPREEMSLQREGGRSGPESNWSPEEVDCDSASILDEQGRMAEILQR